MENETESKRGRVRRLVIEPLQADGFRFRRGTDDSKARAALDRLADALGYMSDTGLTVLRAALATKGEGSARCFWPAHATVIGLAEAFEPRPLREIPELRRWFASRAGAEALLAGRHVAEYEFWRQKKRPPISRQDGRLVAERAQEWQSRAERIRDRLRRGVPLLQAEDQAWLEWYEARGREVEALIEAERAA